jgi:hypothetical protein
MNSRAAATVSSSIVSIRFLVSGGVLNDLATVAIRLGPRHTARAKLLQELGILRIIQVLGLL